MLLQPQTISLIDIINKGKYKRIAEIGCLEGVTAYHVSSRCESITKYYMVDPWQVFKGEGTGKLAKVTQERWDKIHLDICQRFRSDPRFEILRMASSQAVKLFNPESLDVVFIDALHTYDAVKADIKAWLPIVSHGGILCGDDYAGKYPGVSRAVNEIFKDRVEFADQGKRVWIYRK